MWHPLETELAAKTERDAIPRLRRSESGLGDQFNVMPARSAGGEDSHGTQVVAFDTQRRALPAEESKVSDVAQVGVRKWMHHN